MLLSIFHQLFLQINLKLNHSILQHNSINGLK